MIEICFGRACAVQDMTGERAASFAAASRLTGCVTTRPTITPVFNVLWDDYGMSGNVYAHDAGVASDPFGSGDGNVFQRVVLMQSDVRKAAQARANAKGAGAPLEPTSVRLTARS